MSLSTRLLASSKTATVSIVAMSASRVYREGVAERMLSVAIERVIVLRFRAAMVVSFPKASGDGGRVCGGLGDVMIILGRD